jgi:hypothetical protein
VDDQRIALQLELFPLVLVDMGGPERTLDDVRAMFEGFRAVRQRCVAERIRWVLVASSKEMPTAVERKILVDESNKLTPAEHKLCVACVAVIPHGFVRGVITALSWMIPNVSPIVAAATTDAAVDIAVDRLQRAGIDIPSEAVVRAADWFHRND